MESIIPNSLKSYNKVINLKYFNHNRYKEFIRNIRIEGIAVLGTFILGNDEEDSTIFSLTSNFIKSSHIDVLQASKLTPLPGTKLWKTMLSQDRIINKNFSESWNDYRFSTMVYKPAKMTIEEVYQGFTYLRKVYYSFWATVKRTLSTLLTTKSIISTIIAFKFNSSYKKAFKESEHFKLYNKLNFKKKFKT